MFFVRQKVKLYSYTYIHTYTYIRTYIHTYTHIYIHTQTDIESKGRFVRLRTMKPRRDSRGIAPLTLNFGTIWSGQLHAPAALLPGNEAGTHSVGGQVEPKVSLDVLEKRKYLAYDGNRNPDRANSSVFKTGVHVNCMQLIN